MQQSANFKCPSTNFFYCAKHYGEQVFLDEVNRDYTKLQKVLSSASFDRLKANIFERVRVLSQCKESILVDARYLITVIEKSSKIAITNLDKNIEECLRFLTENNYSDSECVQIQALFKTRNKLSFVQLDDAYDKINNKFDNRIIVEQELESSRNVVNSQPLEKRYKDCTNRKLQGFGEIIPRREEVQEIKFTNDGKYVFVCKFYEDCKEELSN
jgi:hypothetical protein